ncbi:hypothetical protein THAOC_06964, partial [Thalassiosira oceanica]
MPKKKKEKQQKNTLFSHWRKAGRGRRLVLQFYFTFISSSYRRIAGALLQPATHAASALLYCSATNATAPPAAAAAAAVPPPPPPPPQPNVDDGRYVVCRVICIVREGSPREVTLIVICLQPLPLFPLVEPPRSIAVAAPDAVPSAAAAGKQSDDDPMEIKEEEEPAAVNQVDLVVSAGADRKLSGGPKNEDDEGDEAEAGDYEAT